MFLEEKTKIKQILSEYPDIESYFNNLGIQNIQAIKNLSIKAIAQMKKTDSSIIIKQLIEYIKSNDNSADVTLDNMNKNGELTIKGVLPCPVRIPLLETINKAIKHHNRNKFVLDLLSASAGTSWLKEQIDFDNPGSIPDVTISAGFDFFFGESAKKQIKNGFFIDITPKTVNKTFENIHIKDPLGAISILGVVPAVFMINTKLLKNRSIPKKWETLLESEYENSVSIPVGDFDLFNSLLIHIYNRFGYDGIKRLANIMMVSNHPSLAIKKQKSNENTKPAITIMPYFFSKMAKNIPDVKIIWPEDGAIISPIFAQVKRETLSEVKIITDILSSKRFGEILAHEGRFPSTHPDVDNKLKSEFKFWWIGWEYIYKNNIESLVNELIEVFKGGIS